MGFPVGKSRSLLAKGFTLVEILVVVVIIAVLLTLAGVGIGNLTAGKGTSSAIATSQSLFEEARIIAVSKGCRARVMVDVNNPSSEEYLQRIVIVHERIENGLVVPGEWVLASRGYTLPKGVFFSNQFSRIDRANPSGDSPVPREPLIGENVSARYAGNYAYYEFNSRGIFQQPGASFVIGSGVRSVGGEPRVKSGELDFLGFVIWRNGRTSSFKNPRQILGATQPTNF